MNQLNRFQEKQVFLKEHYTLGKNKLDQKVYRRHSGYVGSMKETKYGHLMEKKPEFAMMEAVRRMLPKSKLGRQMLKKLRVFRGSEHNHAAQKPELIKLEG